MAHTNNTDLELFARCASGFEQTLATELKQLHARRVRPLRGGVAFFGSLAHAYSACLWCRVATRIQLVLARVPASNAQALYDGVASVCWEDHIGRGATIFVDAHGQNDQLRNTKFTALKVKDALCDRLRDKRGSRPDVDTVQPDVSINVALHQQKATLYLNLSGPSLHRRGYRQDGVSTEAPLKETLAAGLLLAAGWPEVAREGGVLVDPMCGSGTLAIEAALMLQNRAPGLLRTHWGFQGWRQHDEKLWHTIVEQARSTQHETDTAPRILAGDINPQALAIARDNAERAQVLPAIRFYKGDVARLGRYLKRLHGYQDSGGLLVANPPYGQRLLSGQELPSVYEALSTGIQAIPAGWDVALITPDAGVDSSLGRTPHATIACHNGPINTWIRLYHTDEPRLEQHVTSLAGLNCHVPIAEPNSAQFASRLRKVARERSKWARREQVDCYRVYDADLPEFAFSVDLFVSPKGEGSKRYVRLAEHRRPKSVDPQRAARRLADAASIACATLDVPRTHVCAVGWDEEPEPFPIVVAEGPYSFAIDLTRPDARLALSQRRMRDLAATLARDKRVACLFATGTSALVHAAEGARDTLLVDASRAQLDAAQATMRDNGFGGRRHRTVCQDVRTWLEQETRARHTYDVVLCNAPSWLPAKDAGKRDWDLRDEHVGLLRSVADLLASGGTLLFSCPDANFQPDLSRIAAAGLNVEDASRRMVPHDFERTRVSPCCLLVHKDDPA
ncbi:MAG: bifunctional 23S rRNA (guanine(2069)-N(7))-methyltransferase RlmK/23S rRNA (guanine(2445)-N(2))-methyltransferase RlmL [Coriobacteriales bacterium]|nr:bifunctional 23S rRNA (guanine(2069)-N(7))-methyltransferase RlmK/23S rRNA (guanine(2445)-N(2))-methyltransferase RlmL [Coriobacteriales bacterium]